MVLEANRRRSQVGILGRIAISTCASFLCLTGYDLDAESSPELQSPHSLSGATGVFAKARSCLAAEILQMSLGIDPCFRRVQKNKGHKFCRDMRASGHCD